MTLSICYSASQLASNLNFVRRTHSCRQTACAKISHWCFAGVLAVLAPAVSLGADFVPLFDGKSIDGWVQRGGKAKYTVEDGMIVGTAVAKTPNSFLCTPRDYRDFILELELNCDLGLNSGVMIRAQYQEEPYKASGTNSDGTTWQAKIAAKRVHGYQVEIDHRKHRRWSGGIYDEARRGWIHNLEADEFKPARQAFRFGAWNHYRIECRGDSIQTWVNGVPATNLIDNTDASGYIGLQVHSVIKPDDVGLQARWRNLRIKEL